MPAPTFFEGKRAEYMAERFRSLGWEAKLDRAGNVIASLPGFGPGKKDNAPAVAVTAHLDTVLAPRVPEDIKIGGDGRMLGPGVADNGAGLTALLALAAMWTAGAPLDDAPLTPVLVANVGEEGITFTGGVTRNIGMVEALQKGLGTKLNVSDDSHFMGALGAALFALDHVLAGRAPAATGRAL